MGGPGIPPSQDERSLVAPFAEHDRYVQHHGADAVVQAVRPFLTEARVARIETALAGRLASVQVAIERPQDPHNAAAVVRSAEALGCTDVHVVAAEEGALHARGTTQGAFHWIDTHHWENLDQLCSATRNRGLRLVGAVMDGAHTPHTLPVDKPVCVLLGNESHGLSDAALTRCDTTVGIEMHGMSESLNLSVSAAILLYTLCHRRRSLLGTGGDLSAEATQRRRAYGYARSVDARLLAGLFTG